MHNNEKLNIHLQKIIKTHFDPLTGTPYWLNKAKTLGINPLKDVKNIEDLKIFDLLNEDDLKTTYAEHFIPQSQLNFDLYFPHVYETGGTSSKPKKILDTVHQIQNAHWVARILEQHGFSKKGNWLNFFPSGPHAVSLFTYHIAHYRKELCYFIDIDPRWIKFLIKEDLQDTIETYLNHLIKQALDILDSQNITYLFITPKLLEKLSLHYEIASSKIKGIVCGGTQITNEFHRFIKTEIAPKIDFCALYGNTLMGVAPQAPPKLITPKKDNWSINYYSYFPHFMIEIVDNDDPSKTVNYYERGRVKITVLNHDIFIPGLLERDSGIRIPPCDKFSFDGIADVKVLPQKESVIIEGVY